MNNSVFYLATLGCKVNQYETQALREAWLTQGCAETDTPEAASVIIVNSCAVTAKAVADVRNTVRRLHRAAPHASVIITGCAAEGVSDELAQLPGVAAILGQAEKSLLLQPHLIFTRLSEKSPALQENSVAPHIDHSSFARNAALKESHAFPPFHISGYDRSRAVLKIQDGCSHRCTYCIVPLTRGRATSREPQEAFAEVERLLQAGFREIGINGVNLRQFRILSSSAVSYDFWDFMAELDERFGWSWAGQARFRMSSLEPGQLGEKALRVLQKSRIIAPHLHLSLQSGSVSVLHRMGRGHYDPGTIANFLQELGASWKLFGLGADILTGFPGETEAEHLETMALCAALPLSYAHVFPYSKRPGTVAATLPNQVDANIKKRRAAELRALFTQKQEAFLQKQLALPVLHIVPEHEEKSALHGVNEFYSECRVLPSLTAVQGTYDAQLAAVRPLQALSALLPVRPVRVEKGVLLVSE